MIATVTLPFPPSANALGRAVHGRVIRSKPYRDWLRIAKTHCYGVKRIAGPYILTVVAQRPDKRRRDLGNLLKATEDLLTEAGIIEDDHLAQSIMLSWSAALPDKRAAIAVTVEAL